MYYYFLFFFNDTATTEIYTLSLHDALPILACEIPDALAGELRIGAVQQHILRWVEGKADVEPPRLGAERDRKSTRLNSSHANISYAVFCLKKKKQYQTTTRLITSHNSLVIK